jgi:5-methylcytosine-specific restriction protein A
MGVGITHDDGFRAAPLVTRLRGRALQRRRALLFAAQPWCVDCLEDGRRTNATVRKHRCPLAEGGTEDPTNELALCLDCADRRTEAESLRGGPGSKLTPRFRKRSAPRNATTGQFSPRLTRVW